ncbi:MAG: DUF2798 domain-containing protein [Neisseria sp.]|nr:DUF2798 domain-containing protein [Neisseria sp.]
MSGFIPKRYTKTVFAFYMAATMALLMSAAIVALNTGFGGNYFSRVFRAYVFAMPIAFCCVTIVRPLVSKLVLLTVKQ